MEIWKRHFSFDIKSHTPAIWYIHTHTNETCQEHPIVVWTHTITAVRYKIIWLPFLHSHSTLLVNSTCKNCEHVMDYGQCLSYKMIVYTMYLQGCALYYSLMKNAQIFKFV